MVSVVNTVRLCTSLYVWNHARDINSSNNKTSIIRNGNYITSQLFDICFSDVACQLVDGRICVALVRIFKIQGALWRLARNCALCILLHRAPRCDRVESWFPLACTPWFNKYFHGWHHLGVALQQVQLDLAWLDLPCCSGHRNRVDHMATHHSVIKFFRRGMRRLDRC